MKVINFGSLNLDYVYQVKTLAQPGETVPCDAMTRFPGGKGANQSVALARAGIQVWHAGMLGAGDEWMRSLLQEASIDIRFVRLSETWPSGHAIIQVDARGMNSIIVYGGANQHIPHSFIAQVLDEAQEGDWLVLQNEINLTPELLKAGKAAGMKICFNPAPFTADVLDFPLDCVDVFILNEIEAAGLARRPVGMDLDDLAEELQAAFPESMICITLGADGAVCRSPETGLVRQSAFATRVVDTTAAGDTFTGYFLAEIARRAPVQAALEIACKAAAVTISRHGAIPSIPTRQEVNDFMA
ncbi:MAG TPA: ribokinase [Lentisphaeria bacterium]|nr:ribokinase [Lentisphaeria bacterium]